LSPSVGWELHELVLPFDLAIETIQNKIGNIIVNVLGYSSGFFFNEKSKK